MMSFIAIAQTRVSCATWILLLSFIIPVSRHGRTETASPTAGAHLAAERFGERDDLSAAAGVPGDGARRDTGDGGGDRRSGGRLGFDPQVLRRLDLGPAAAPQTAGGGRLCAGCGVAGIDCRGGTMAGRADGAADRPDGKGNPLRAARRHHRGRNALRGSGAGVRVPARARSHRGRGRASAGAVFSESRPPATADGFHDRGDSGGHRRGDAVVVPERGCCQVAGFPGCRKNGRSFSGRWQPGNPATSRTTSGWPSWPSLSSRWPIRAMLS